MLELMSEKALEVGAERRREVALDTMRAARAGESRRRLVAGTALVAVGRRIAGEIPSPSPKMQTVSDCR